LKRPNRPNRPENCLSGPPQNAYFNRVKGLCKRSLKAGGGPSFSIDDLKHRDFGFNDFS